MENVRNGNEEAPRIKVSGIDIEWNLKKGTCTFQNLPVAMMWVDTTLAGLMSGVQAMVGTERFLLALQSEGRRSVEADWQVISQFPNFPEGFKAIANIAAVAGWGEWVLLSLDEEKRECRFRITDSWEGRYQKALGVNWGSGMLAGKMAGYCSKLFETNCWADQTAFIARGEGFDEFIVRPSSRSIETEIDNLLASDEATRADMAVAIRRLEKEIAERKWAEEGLQKSEEKFRGIFNNARDGILVADIGTKKFILGNAKICRMLGYSLDELTTMGVEDIHPAENLAEVFDRFKKLVRQETILAVDIPVKRKDGSLFFADINSFLIKLDGSACIVGFFRDITERKRTEEALRRTQDELEERVRKRTADLKKAYDRIQKSEEDLRFLATQLLTAQEQERNRISYELHDDVGQSLTVLKMQLRAAEKHLPEGSKAKQDLEVARNYLNHTVETVRRISKALSPSILVDLGLIKALKHLFKETCREIKCTLHADDVDGLFSPEAQITIYRIFQEILNNIVKHARANHLKLNIKKLEKSVQFWVTDNGEGFDVEEALSGKIKDRGLGLTSMKERVNMLGGSFNIESEEGRGTTITINVPFSELGNYIDIST